MNETYKTYLILALILLIGVFTLGYFSLQGVFGGTTINLSLSTTDLSDGLVGHWTFDGDKLIDNATDSSGQGNDGFLTGFTSTTTVIGKIGQALQFNGSNQNVNAPLDINPSAIPVLTISAWVKRNGDVPSSYWTLINNDNGGDFDRGINIFQDETYAIFNGEAGSTGAPSVLNEWEHVVAQWSSSDVIFYKNGVKEWSKGSGENVTTGSASIYFGEASNGTLDCNCQIDDVRVYDRALSAKEVSKLYQLGGTTHINTTITTDDLSDGLVGHWTFDGGDLIENAVDKSGNGNTGYLTGFTSTTTAPGKIGQALDFDGSDDSVSFLPLESTNKQDLNITGDMSFEAWIYATSSREHGVIDNGYEITGTDGGWAVWLTPDEEITFGAGGILNNAVVETAASAFTLNQWEYIVITRSGDEVLFYVNGYSSATTSVSNVDINYDFGRGTYIGRRVETRSDFGQNGVARFDGFMDEVAVWNKALSAAEVATRYNSGAGTVLVGDEDNLVMAWHMDETDWATEEVANSANNRNYVSKVVGSLNTTASGKLGRAGAFNGVTGEYILFAPNEMSFSLWLKPDDIDTILLNKTYNFSLNEYGYHLQTNANGQVVFSSHDTLSNANAATVAVSTGVVATSTWVHIGVVKDGTDVSFYLDGILDSTDTVNSTAIVSNISSSVDISTSGDVTTYGGDWEFGNNQFTDGIIDDVRIYNRALSAKEVSKLYELGGTTHINTTINTTDLSDGLVGHWTFDGDDLIENAIDRSGNGNTGYFLGTMADATSTVIGRVGQGLRFNGTDDVISIPDSASLDFPNGFTASTWIKRETTVREIFYGKGGFGTATDGSFFLEFPNDDKIRLIIYEEGVSNTEEVITAQTMTDTEWHLITGTYDGATIKIFIDGVQDVNTTSVAIVVRHENNELAIGNRGNVHDFGFQGLMDDARLYDRALSATEISRLYKLGR